MDARLEAIRRMIRPGCGVIDVGTDHAYLPLSLARDGYPGALLASDLREGPLAAARRSAAQAGLSGRLCFLLADGLDACPPDAVDTIVIAGMGGDTICGILDRAEWCMNGAYRLILQPMTKPEVLRYWLTNNGFRIEEEALAEDAGTVYQILSAVFCGRNERLSDAELFVGKAGLSDPALYRRLIDMQICRAERSLAGLAASGKTEDRKADGLRRLICRLQELQKGST